MTIPLPSLFHFPFLCHCDGSISFTLLLLMPLFWPTSRRVLISGVFSAPTRLEEALWEGQRQQRLFTAPPTLLFSWLEGTRTLSVVGCVVNCEFCELPLLLCRRRQSHSCLACRWLWAGGCNGRRWYPVLPCRSWRFLCKASPESCSQGALVDYPS